MCGICFCFASTLAPPPLFSFKFNPFKFFTQNPYIQRRECLPEAKNALITPDYIENVFKKELFISDFSIADIRTAIEPRGPDGFHSILLSENKKDSNQVNLDMKDESIPFFATHANESEKECFRMLFSGSVLHLRGEVSKPNLQPIQSEKTGNVLIYNGEIYSLNERKINEKTLGVGFSPYKNDTIQLFEILETFSLEFYKSSQKTDKEGPKEEGAYEDSIARILEIFLADFSVVFYDRLNKRLSMAKDIFGKRSLLLGIHQRGFAVTSCTPSQRFLQTKEPSKPNEQDDQEDLNENNVEQKYLQELNTAIDKEWVELPLSSVTVVKFLPDNKLEFSNKEFKTGAKLYEIKDKKPMIFQRDEACKEILLVFLKNLKRLVKNIFTYKKYFIEEKKLVDISVKAALDVFGSINNENNSNEFGFKEEEKASALTASKPESEKNASGREEEGKEEKIDLSYNKTNVTKEEISDSSIAVLFSGGLDSTFIAHCLSILLPKGESIDLINVSFSEDSPDRKTSQSAYLELKKLHPTRRFNLIFIDKTMKDIDTFQSQILKTIYPKITHMDFNIATVLNFATRNEGYRFDGEVSKEKKFCSGSKIILSGLGADEIFGGYMRYWVAFRRGGFEELKDEMKFDLNRLWIRNLGRDDRSISSNGKEARFPFLCGELVEKVFDVDFQLLTDMNKPKGEGGEKQLLRYMAEKMGLKETAHYKKRAIQFGTRIAKQLNVKTFGSNRRAKGTKKFVLEKK